MDVNDIDLDSFQQPVRRVSSKRSRSASISDINRLRVSESGKHRRAKEVNFKHLSIIYNYRSLSKNV